MMQQAPGMAPPPQFPPQSHHYHQQPPHPYQQQPQPQQPQHWMMPPAPQQQPQVWGQQQPLLPHQQMAPAGPQPQQQQQQQYHQQPAPGPQPGSVDDIRTLWIGDLQYWMDENYLVSCFAQTNEVVSAKVIRNKQTQQSEGYGFVEFRNRAAAEQVLNTYNGVLMPNVEQNFRLNWALYGAGERRPDDSPDYTIFVGDLAADVSDYTLLETFRGRFPSIKGAKVVIDRITGRSKGYGFVRFADESEQVRAMTEMNGVLCSSRPMRIGPAASKKNNTGGGSASYQSTPGTQSDSDPNNTTIFVGNLDSSVTDDALRQVFSSCGELVHVKIPVGKRCGFVQFVNRSSAEDALQKFNGYQLGGQNIRLSWGRSPSNKQDASVGAVQPQGDVNQWNSGAGYYGYTQAYDSYGYAAQDPNMYYGGYAGYGNYAVPPQQQPQQQVPPQ